MQSVVQYLTYVLRGFECNLVIAATSFALGLATALALCIASTYRLGTAVARIYTLVFRSIPPIVLLSMVYWLLPTLIPIKLSPLTAGIIAFALRSTAFQVMILRSSMSTVSSCEIEAAQALGLDRLQLMAHIVLPQSLRKAVPALTNEYASLLKESTQALAIGVLDALARARYVSIATGYNLAWITTLAVLMYVASWIVIKASNLLYRKLAVPGTMGFEAVSGWATSWRQ